MLEFIKKARGVERRKLSNRGARYMWRRERTLLDPTVGGGGASLHHDFRFLISKRRTFVNCYLFI